MYILSEHSEESIHTGHSWTNIFQTSIQLPMQTFAATRRQLIADILDSHLSFDSVRACADWDELTCLEQMTLEDLLDCYPYTA